MNFNHNDHEVTPNTMEHLQQIRRLSAAETSCVEFSQDQQFQDTLAGHYLISNDSHSNPPVPGAVLVLPLPSTTELHWAFFEVVSVHPPSMVMSLCTTTSQEGCFTYNPAYDVCLPIPPLWASPVNPAPLLAARAERLDPPVRVAVTQQKRKAKSHTGTGKSSRTSTSSRGGDGDYSDSDLDPDHDSDDSEENELPKNKTLFDADKKVRVFVSAAHREHVKVHTVFWRVMCEARQGFLLCNGHLDDAHWSSTVTHLETNAAPLGASEEVSLLFQASHFSRATVSTDPALQLRARRMDFKSRDWSLNILHYRRSPYPDDFLHSLYHSSQPAQRQALAQAVGDWTAWQAVFFNSAFHRAFPRMRQWLNRARGPNDNDRHDNLHLFHLIHEVFAAVCIGAHSGTQTTLFGVSWTDESPLDTILENADSHFIEVSLPSDPYPHYAFNTPQTEAMRVKGNPYNFLTEEMQAAAARLKAGAPGSYPGQRAPLTPNPQQRTTAPYTPTSGTEGHTHEICLWNLSHLLGLTTASNVPIMCKQGPNCSRIHSPISETTWDAAVAAVDQAGAQYTQASVRAALDAQRSNFL
jgi:hypothetical protein